MGPALLGHLSGDGADRPRRRRDHQGLARLGLQHVGDAEIGGQAGHPQHREIGGQRQARRTMDRTQPLFMHHRVVGPAARQRRDDVALLETFGSGLLDHAQGQATHDLAQPDGRQIALAVVHPGPIGRVQRQVDGANQDLGILEVRHRRLDQLKVAVLDQALRPLTKNPLTIAKAHGASPMRFL
ncbi:hypothetical protein D3C85_1295250 [compost metagenome]